MTDTKPMREARDIIRDLLAEHHCSAAERAYKEHETGADRIVGALVTAIDKLQPLDPIVDAALDKLIPWLDFGPHQSNEKCVAVRDAVVAAIRAMLLPPLASGGWQPIETAPEAAGSKIVAWCVHMFAQYCDDAIEDGYAAPVIAEWTDFNHGGWVWHGLAGEFTHWQPYYDGIDLSALVPPPGGGG